MKMTAWQLNDTAGRSMGNDSSEDTVCNTDEQHHANPASDAATMPCMFPLNNARLEHQVSVALQIGQVPLQQCHGLIAPSLPG